MLTGFLGLNLPASDEMLIHFSTQIPILENILMATTFFIGCILIVQATFKLKIYGEMRTMMAPHARINQIVILYCAGAALMYVSQATIPLAVDALFGSPHLTQLSYDAHQFNFNSQIQEAVKRVIRLIGQFSFIRGILQIARMNDSGGRHTLSKAITHIIAGACAINIEQTLHLVKASFGIL
jgi:short subunit fatty acids transporter